MSNNENNYIGVSATLVGYTASDARAPGYDKEGTSGVLEIPVAINEGYRPKDGGEFVKTSTTWYTYSAAGSYAETLKEIPKGSKIRIDDAKQEVREYQTKDGESKLAITLRFGTLTVLEGADNGGGF